MAIRAIRGSKESLKVSKALQEVWDMKESAHEETKHLKGAAYFAYIHEQVRKLLPAGTRLRYVDDVQRPVLPTTVAEAKGKYTAKRKK